MDGHPTSWVSKSSLGNFNEAVVYVLYGYRWWNDTQNREVGLRGNPLLSLSLSLDIIITLHVDRVRAWSTFGKSQTLILYSWFILSMATLWYMYLEDANIQNKSGIKHMASTPCRTNKVNDCRKVFQFLLLHFDFFDFRYSDCYSWFRENLFFWNIDKIFFDFSEPWIDWLKRCNGHSFGRIFV